MKEEKEVFICHVKFIVIKCEEIKWECRERKKKRKRKGRKEWNGVYDDDEWCLT